MEVASTTGREKNIDISNKEELMRWSEQLGCTEEDLVEAVLRIGNSVKIVDAYLYLNRKKIKK